MLYISTIYHISIHPIFSISLNLCIFFNFFNFFNFPNFPNFPNFIQFIQFIQLIQNNACIKQANTPLSNAHIQYVRTHTETTQKNNTIHYKKKQPEQLSKSH
jgi:hypothetical protein